MEPEVKLEKALYTEWYKSTDNFLFIQANL